MLTANRGTAGNSLGSSQSWAGVAWYISYPYTSVLRGYLLQTRLGKGRLQDEEVQDSS